MEGFGFWALAVLAAVVVGMGKGGMPVVGMLGVPILSLAVSPVDGGRAVAAGLCAVGHVRPLRLPPQI